MKSAHAILLVLAACATHHLTSSADAAERGTQQPNILLIMADDVGCDALGCYGGESYKTPRLDQLAASGLRFNQCFSMPVCHPTRVCLLTGRYPFRLGNPKWGTFPKNEEKNTFARKLKDAGYATAIAGKWQLVLQGKDLNHPNRLGFDEYCLFGWHEGPRYYDPLIWQNGKQRPNTKGQFGPDIYTEFLIDFMRRNKNGPFIAFYSMALCHDVTDDLEEPVPHGPQGRYDNYEEMIEAMDQRVGRLVDALDEMKLRNNTLVLFTTDNGTPKSYIHSAVDGKLIRKPVVSIWNGKEVPGGKGNLTNDGTNVPLIASWPGKVQSGKVVNDLVDFSDFYATFADLSGAKSIPQPAIDGQSFLARLLGESGESRTWAYSQGRGKHWVRTQHWKLYSDGKFFNVKNDPNEKRALVSDDLPAEGKSARQELEKVIKSLGNEL